jgi:hypothetical protein
MTNQEAVKLWKELDICYAEFEFNCGGDSMNDTTLNFYGNNKKLVNSKELEDFFDNEIYKQVTFYEASDGHYQGEAGIVLIELDTESDNEDEHDFTYSKDSEAEYNETFNDNAFVELTPEQLAFIEKNVSNINGGEDFVNATINYKRDFIMTERDEEIANEIAELVNEFAEDFEFENANGERMNWYSFTTNDNHFDKLTIKDNCLGLELSRTFVVYQQSDW